MSDYFAALMRSSGLFSARRALASDAPLELVGEVPATEAQPPLGVQGQPLATPPRSTEPRTYAPVTFARPAQPARAVAGHDEPTANPPAAPSLRTAVPGDSRLEQPAHRPGLPQPDGRPQRPQAEELVRAAMRWVASDPHMEEPPQQPTAQVSAQPPVQPEKRALASRVIANVRASEEAPPQGQQQPEPAGQNPVSQSLSKVPQAMAEPRPTEPARLLIEPETPLATEQDSLSISIGAIHLRVETPAAQTIAKPTTPVAAPHLPTAQPSSRSGLSRRALRRL